MEIDFKTRKEKLKTLSEEIQHLYWAPESGEVLREIFERFGLDERLYKPYAVTVGDIILGFHPKKHLSSLLQSNLQIPDNTADDMVLALEDFLELVPGELESPIANMDVREELELRPEGAERESSPEKSDTNVASQPLTREDVLHALSSRRTMEDDIESVQKKQGE